MNESVPTSLRPVSVVTTAKVAAVALIAALAGCATPRVTMPPSQAKLGAVQTGEASWYGKPHHGHLTASGEIYDMYRFTAAHPTLPLGTRVVVTNLTNGRSVEVRVNDRGPFVAGRIVDLSYAAAQKLDAISDGVIPVRVRVLSMPLR